MKNEDMEDLLYGLIIGGLIGGVSYYLLKASKTERKEFIQKMGRAVIDACKSKEKALAACEKVYQQVKKGKRR